eukprot:4173235-Alexandrium_andersonii.AAC.1
MPNLLAVSGAFGLLWECACLQDTRMQGATMTDTRARADFLRLWHLPTGAASGHGDERTPN